MFFARLPVLAIAAASLLGPAVAQETIVPSTARLGPQGTYWTEDNVSQVEFFPCGMVTCGRIVWMRKDKDKSGNPIVDKNNPDPAQRSMPLLGLTILSGLRPSLDEPSTWEGEVYNPRDGKTYPVTVMTNSQTQITVKGCGFAGLICRSQEWARVEPTTN